MPRDDEGFEMFLEEVVGVLDDPEPPLAAAECRWCESRESFRAVA